MMIEIVSAPCVCVCVIDDDFDGRCKKCLALYPALKLVELTTPGALILSPLRSRSFGLLKNLLACVDQLPRNQKP